MKQTETDTRQKILDAALELFSREGFSAVGIRNICAKVGIKESSVYYHFKNKQAIFDELILRFKNIGNGFIERLRTAMTSGKSLSSGHDSQVGMTADTVNGDRFGGDGIRFSEDLFRKVCDAFFEQYLMDDFCNRVIRMLQIERQNDGKIQKLYEQQLIETPLSSQAAIFSALQKSGIISTEHDADYLAVKFYAPIFLFANRWLFCGELTAARKKAFRDAAYAHSWQFFREV